MYVSPEEKYQIAFEKLMEDEGGYVNHPKDPGGETKFGITKKELSNCFKKLNLPALVKDLTVAHAKIYYKSEWWDKFHYEFINKTYIPSKIFNMSVNMGSSSSHKIVQRAVNKIGSQLTVDGILGSKSIGYINGVILNGKENQLADLIRENQKEFYENLVLKRPDLNVFLKGWLKRATY